MSQRPTAHGLHLRVELIDQSGDRQLGAVAPRLVETDGEILAHPIDRETEVEFSGDHGLVAVLHLPGLRGALGDGGDELFDIEAGFHGEVQRLGEPFDDAGDANLVRHLGELPGAGGAHQIAGTRIGGDHFFGRRERRRLAAAHHREHAVLGAGLAARDRRVDEFKAALLCLGMKLARDLSRGGGVIDHDGARPHAGKYALLAQHHLAQIVVVADAGHDESPGLPPPAAASGRFCRRAGKPIVRSWPRCG